MDLGKKPYTESVCRPPPKPLHKPLDIYKMPRIISIFDMDVNKDHLQREIYLALKIRPEITVLEHNQLASL